MLTLKSGLDPESQFVLGETREEFAQLQAEYYDRFTAATPEIRFQIDNLIRNEWMLRRFFRVEAQLWEYQSMVAERGTGVELGEAFTRASATFMRLGRRVAAAEKAYKDAKTELDRLLNLLQPEQNTPQTEQLASFRKPAIDKQEIDQTIAGMESELNRQLDAMQTRADNLR